MQIDKIKIIKKAIMLISAIIIILLLVLGVLSSDFTKLKKYDIAGKSPRETILSQLMPSSINNGMKVSVTGEGSANLGDFVFNISENKKLIANISIKYKPTKKKNSWFSSSNEMQREILEKGVILRDATIDTMLGYTKASANNDTMRRKLKETLNKNLINSEVEEVYFNEFIIQ
ncbi:MAG: flagellar basal body-associated FliL family protein [Sulfurimonas sp.]|uniref:flagellar basal body-associated FliL family protein n=1 Tax=Sulfurimonas sp. TaxID=2022749 RepID=UPI0025FC01B0|nr:flagellar basal body-associated FliL family protein [Sulfurimonas sp.]MCK9453792.1 flagellar basal body-associated FliL family protein [Sulfurimonas sp.]